MSVPTPITREEIYLNEIVERLGNPTPTGKKNITDTTETDVSAYATAQVVDANLIAGNIKKDVSVLGITGTYEGGGGSSDFVKVEITLSCDTEGNWCEYYLSLKDATETKTVAYQWDNSTGVVVDGSYIEVQYGTPVTVSVYLHSEEEMYINETYTDGLDQYTVTGGCSVKNLGTEAEPYYYPAVSGTCSISAHGTVAQ